MATINTNVGIVSFIRSSLDLDPTESVALVLCAGNAVLATLRVDAHPELEAQEFASSITRILRGIDAQIDATVLVSYEGEKALTFAQYDELTQHLKNMSAPIRKAILVTDGKIMDYDGDSTDAVNYTEVHTDPFTLEAMMRTGRQRLAADAPQCTQESAITAEVSVRRVEELKHGDYGNIETLGLGECMMMFANQMNSGMMHSIADYLEVGQVSEELAGWISGTFATLAGRDFAIAALAGNSRTEQEVKDLLIGEALIEDRKIFEAGAAMLYESLAFIAGTNRANILAALAWTRWMTGQGTEAMKFVTQALDADPHHRLTKLLRQLFTSGKLPKSASKRDK